MSIFADPLLLVNQAHCNITEFEEICDRFFADNNGAQRIDVDPQTGNKTFKFVFEGALPERARYLCHSCITDLRHALDQATCIAFERVTGTPAHERLYFPITSHPNDLRGRVTKDFPPELHSVLMGLEAYPTSPNYEGGSDILCGLSTAAQDKHRLVPKVGAVITSFWGGGITGSCIVKYTMPPRWDFANNELIIGVTTAEGNIEANFNLAFYVAFDQPGPLKGRPINSTIREMIDTVEKCVTEISKELIKLPS